MNLNLGGSYIDSPDWVNNKNVTINLINGDDKCFQHAATVALNHEEIGENSQRISKIKFFKNKYDWKGTNYPSGKDDWKEFEINNPSCALNVLHVKIINIYSTYISKHNSNHEN